MLQRYAARDSFLLTVPLFCGVLLCAPRDADTASGMRTPPSLRVGSPPPLGEQKRKKHRDCGVSLFMVHLQGFEPGTH